MKYFPDKEIRVAAFLPQDSSSGPTDTTKLALIGHPTVVMYEFILIYIVCMFSMYERMYVICKVQYVCVCMLVQFVYVCTDELF